jgi:non-specific protein-tyrosine kinase
MELRRYANIFWKWLWLILLGTTVAAATAFFTSRRMTPVYEASATLLIQQAENPAVTYSDILSSERLAKTYAELLTKPAVLDAAAERLGLPEIGTGSVSVESVRDTQLIEVKAEHVVPELASEIANTIPLVFIERNEAQQTRRFSESQAALADELGRLQTDIETVQTRIDSIGEPATAAQTAELTRLQTALSQYRSSYATLLSSYEAMRVAEAQATDNVIMVQEAEAPVVPVRPKTMTNTLLAAVVGAMLAAGTALLIEYLDDTVKSPEDVLRVLGLSTLGAVARMRQNGQAGGLGQALVAAESPKSPVSEAFRILRTNILFAGVDKPIRRLLVTSPGPTDGKSITAANLAMVIAQAGQSVVLVDSDLRRPILHRLFQVPNTTGLTGVALAGSNPGLDGCLEATQVENLQVLPSGQLPPNPSELLGSLRMGELIEELEQETDVLVFDSPPVLAVTDAAVLAKQVDGVLLVLDAGQTREQAAKRALEELAKVGAPILGVVLNKVPLRRGRGYGYYYYYHYHYYDSEDGHGRGRRSRKPQSSWLERVVSHLRKARAFRRGS